MDDVTEADVPTFGVMVTTTGYQSGARNVADTYGIVILELRQPTDVDLADRVLEVNIMVKFRIPRVVDLEVEVVSALSEINKVGTLSSEILIENNSGQLCGAVDLFCEGEINDIKGPLTPFHRVTRTFKPPLKLLVEGRPLGLIAAIHATVGEVSGNPEVIRVGGIESLAWMLNPIWRSRLVHP